MITESEKGYYTSNELLEIFKEQHRLCSPLDPIADETFALTRQTKIYEWQEAQDLLPWKEFAEFLNQEFSLNVPIKEWKGILNPDDKKTLGDVCDFLSTKAKKEIIKPIKRLGAECLTAAIFLTLKRNLKNKGADVTGLKPSTRIEQFLSSTKNFSPLMEESTLTGVKIFDAIEYGELSKERRFKYWTDCMFLNWIYKKSLKTGSVQTFRDLVEKIIDNQKLGVTANLK
jgi:hypothetical protein